MMPEESENPLHERESGASVAVRDSSIIPNHPSFSLANYSGIRGSMARQSMTTSNTTTIPMAINISGVTGNTTAHAIHEMDQKERQKREEEEKQQTVTKSNFKNLKSTRDHERGREGEEESEDEEENEHKEEKSKNAAPSSSAPKVLGPGGNINIKPNRFTTILSFLQNQMIKSLGVYYNRPLLLLSCSVFFAWVYTMIPTTNYWIYYLVKSQWWVVLTLITYIEIQFVNIPDLSDTSYIVMYIGGFLLAPLTHIVRWVLNDDNNFTVSSLSVLFSFIVVVIVSGVDCFLYPKSIGERRAISSASTSSTLLLAAANMARNHQLSTASTGSSAATSIALSYSPMFLATKLSLFQFNPADGNTGNTATTPSDDGIEPQFNRASVSFMLPHEQAASTISGRTMSVSPMNSRLASMESNTNRSGNPLSSYEVELQSSQSGNSSSTAAMKVYREFSQTSLGTVNTAGTINTNNTSKSAIPRSQIGLSSTDSGSRIQSSDSNLVSVSLRDSEFLAQRNSLFFRKNNANQGLCSSFFTSNPIAYYCLGGFLLNIDNYWFLPRYWNVNYSQLINTLKPNTDRRMLWVFTTCFNLFYSIYYVFLIYFTEYFRHQRQAFSSSGHDDDDDTNSSNHDSESVRDPDKGLTRIYLFLFYIVCNTFLRVTLKSIGMYLDKKKECSISMYFIAEVMSLFFYYTFYRVLFESITSILEFLLFQVLHLCSEWILYIGRCTNWYYVTTEYCIQRFVPVAFVQQPRLSHRSWQVFITLDFGIRCAILVVTGYGMLLLLTTIQFVPYLNPHNDLAQSDYDYSFTAVLIAVAVVIELWNAAMMVYVYFKPQQLEVMEEVRHCFSFPHFALLAMMVGANLFINPIFAFTTGVSGLKG